MVRFPGNMDGIDVVVRLDLALAVDLAGIRVDEAEAVQDYLGSFPLGQMINAAGRLVSNIRAALADVAVHG